MPALADAALRRLLDVTVAGALLIALSPFLAVLALLVRATSPGPALFRQTRIGRDGRSFALLKLRTMRADAVRTGPAITAGADPRITPLGARLRRAKLDELPQLWNVLCGDMSLVGPRPEVPHYVARYTPAQRAVLRARPGLTDPASLAWSDEAATLATFSDPHRAYAEVVLPQKLALSLAYLDRRTVWSDLAVVTRTAAHVVRAALVGQARGATGVSDAGRRLGRTWPAGPR
jgi:lipopolysaccharide/colanic/teichoic acid biosynthesis glycosyltransferase